ncbi:hypothetical protein DMB90_10900 [Raoultella planticola]|uniref:Fimbrial-type adhesion domain-containing protein n=1 Tax=Raoultella planticola TaxID=575 RepID=A0A5P6A9U7_RAOPL|nr:hypothetical protein DMB90_10900 [Raoultella planticola]
MEQIRLPVIRIPDYCAKPMDRFHQPTCPVPRGCILQNRAHHSRSGNRKNSRFFIMRNNQSTAVPESTFQFINFSVRSTGCSVNNSAISVNMGSIKKSAFSGIDSWPASTNTKDIDIALSCTAGTKVSLRVDGTAENSAKGILKLSAVPGAASGVGIQLLYNNSPLALASLLPIGTAGTTMTIPLQARYYQTQSTVTPGAANSYATFTMTYQ